jgi:putative spermidine/putrescine transport system ATP-binding protein
MENSPLSPALSDPGTAENQELAVEGLRKTYGSVVAVDSLSFGVAKGEFFGLLGPSGCGKSTTLKMIAGLEDPDRGDIFLKGRRINDIPVHKRQAAMVFQNYALFPHMTVFNNVAFGLRMIKVDSGEIRRRVEEVLTLVQLPDVGDRYPGQLSGGQQQRIALARVLALKPGVLLLDEPLSNLDAKLRETMRIELKDIQRRVGITAIFVTHDIQEAFALSDRVAVMNQGRVEQMGTPQEIYNSPSTEFVATFVGQPNFFDGHIEALNAGSATFRCGQGICFQLPEGNGLKQGDRGRLVIRPEKISINPVRQGKDNSFEGKISRAIYLGEITKYLIDVQGTRFLANGARFIQEGSRIWAEWDKEDNFIIR